MSITEEEYQLPGDTHLFSYEVKCKLESTIREYEETCKTLSTFTDKRQHNAIIPLGEFGLIEGTLVDTNNLFCDFGEGYGAWKSARGAKEYLERRISRMKKDLDTYNDKIASFSDVTNRLKEVMSISPQDEILEFIPNEGEPYLVNRPKPIQEPISQAESVMETPSVPKQSTKEDILFRSMDLDNSFIQERGQGVIEENEVLVRGEWKQECDEEEEYEEEEEMDDEPPHKPDTKKGSHCCDNCGASNVTFVCSRCKMGWYCSKECQMKHWSLHKMNCKKVQTNVSVTPPTQPIPESNTLKVTPKQIVEKKIESVKNVVIERQYERNTQVDDIKQVAEKPKRKSLFRQNFERDNDVDEMVNKIPMHYGYFRTNEDCGLPDSVIEERIPKEVKEASTFEELFDALCDFKVNLESNTIVEKVSLTMDVPDVPTGDNEEVMVDLDIKVKNGFRSNLLFDSPKGNKDITIGFQEGYFNTTRHLDYIISQFKYDVIRSNRVFQIAYSHPNGFFGLPFSLSYLNAYQNLLKESSVNLSSDVLQWEICSQDKRSFLNLQCAWRTVSPFGDLEEESVLKTRCSQSMLQECRPSLRMGITAGYRNDTRDSSQQPTSGQKTAVSMTLNGWKGDVHSIKVKQDFEKHIPIIPEILDEPGLILHLATSAGYIHNFGKRTTRFVDRFFIDQGQIHGYETRDFGPKSSIEADGGRKVGDVLGGDRFATFSAGISLPFVFSKEYTLLIRSKLFYEVGNVWNANQSFTDIWQSAKSSFGLGLSIPLMKSSLFEINYLFKQKRFGFSFTM